MNNVEILVNAEKEPSIVFAENKLLVQLLGTYEGDSFNTEKGVDIHSGDKISVLIDPKKFDEPNSILYKQTDGTYDLLFVVNEGIGVWFNVDLGGTVSADYFEKEIIQDLIMKANRKDFTVDTVGL